MTTRKCIYCGSRDVWDRVLYLDAIGEVTTYPAAKMYVESVICLACNQLQPLGNSDEHASPEVRDEIRAAEIAANLTGSGCEMSYLECCGFNDEPPALRGGGSLLLDTSSVRAGYLARAIVEHELEREGRGR